TPAEQQQCNALLDCVYRTGCAYSGTSPLACYCGGLPSDSCIAAPFSGPGAPAGACHNLILSAAGTGLSSNGAGLSKLGQDDNAAGWPFARLACKNANCKADCFKPPHPSTPAPATPPWALWLLAAAVGLAGIARARRSAAWH